MCPIRGVSLRGKSKLVTKEKSIGYCNLAMGEVCGSLSITNECKRSSEQSIKKKDVLDFLTPEKCVILMPEI